MVIGALMVAEAAAAVPRHVQIRIWPGLAQPGAGRAGQMGRVRSVPLHT